MRRYERKSVEVGVFRRGWVTLNADFRGKGAWPTNHSWYQSNGVIALSCGIKISAVRHLVLSQCTRVTDKQTDGQTHGQNYDSQDRPRICSRGKKERNRKSEIKHQLNNKAKPMLGNYMAYQYVFECQSCNKFFIGYRVLQSVQRDTNALKPNYSNCITMPYRPNLPFLPREHMRGRSWES